MNINMHTIAYAGALILALYKLNMIKLQMSQCEAASKKRQI
ncbi:MAG: hypothetical protein ABIH74_05505 [Candidatus Omnitrophota bacterium]